MTTNHELLSRITARPDVFGGKPIVRDMRISVELILSLLSKGATQAELLDYYPGLEPDDIRACIAYQVHHEARRLSIAMGLNSETQKAREAPAGEPAGSLRRSAGCALR